MNKIKRTFEKMIVQLAVNILCRDGILGGAPTLNAIHAWMMQN